VPVATIQAKQPPAACFREPRGSHRLSGDNGRVTPSPRRKSTDAGSSRPASWPAATALFLIVAAVFALSSARSTLSMDVWSGNLASWRIATTGAPWLDTVSVPQLDNHPTEEIWVQTADNGHRVIARTPGIIAAGLPAYWITMPDTMTALPGSLTAAFLSALAAMLLFLSLCSRLPRREALLASALFALTTPVWSVAANGLWPHTVTILGISGMAWAASKERWWLVGLFGGVVLWGRLHGALIVAVLGLLLAFWRRRPAIAVAVGAVSSGFMALISLWSRWMYGTWDPTASYDTGVFAEFVVDNRLSPTNQLGFWISPDRGILVWTPLLLLLAPALVRAWRDLPDWSRALLLGGLAYTLLQGTLNRFSGGDTFYGYRLGLEFLACATPAFALAAGHMGRWARRFFGPVAMIQFTLILPGAVTDSYYVAAEDVWTDNAFAMAWRENPAFLTFVLVAMLVAGVLAQRIWADPGLTTERTSGPDRAASASGPGNAPL
jgi:hypothetical protein